MSISLDYFHFMIVSKINFDSYSMRYQVCTIRNTTFLFRFHIRWTQEALISLL